MGEENIKKHLFFCAEYTVYKIYIVITMNTNNVFPYLLSVSTVKLLSWNTFMQFSFSGAYTSVVSYHSYILTGPSSV
jgi:hypothetical protein